MLSRIPRDVILQILFASRIEDVLSLERTCTVLRDIVATRYHWLTQLQNLDQVHAPDLPPHGVDVHDLSAAQLRDLVVKAVFSYRNWRDGEDVITTCKRIVLSDDLYEAPPGLEPSPSCVLWTVLTPGGRFLFLVLDYNVSEEKRLIVINTQSNEIVWSYSGPESGIACCGLEMRRDGSMMAFVVSRTGTGVRLEIIELAPSPENGFRVREQWSFLFDNTEEARLSCPCIEGDYAALVLNGKITIINWKEDWVIRMFGPWEYIGDMLIQSEHLLYIGESLEDECRLTAIPLRLLERPGHREVQELYTGAVRKCTLRTSDLVPDGFDLFDTPRRLSLCTFSWKTSMPETVITIFLLLESGSSSENQDKYLVVTQVIFDSHESTSAILKILRHTRAAKCPFLSDKLGRLVQFEPQHFFTPSQSTRTLLHLTFYDPDASDGDVTGFQQGQERPPPDAPFFDVPQDAGKPSADILSYVGLDEHGEIYFTPATELTNLRDASSPRYSIQVTPSSGTILCVRRRLFSGSVEILYADADHRRKAESH